MRIYGIYPMLLVCMCLCFGTSPLFAQIPPVTPPQPGETPLGIEGTLNKKGDPNDKIKKGTEPSDNDTEIKEDQDAQKEEQKNKEDEELKIKFDARQAKLPKAKIWGQQFFRDQSISLFTRARDIKAIDRYLLGIGDELAITVWGRTDYSTSVRIDGEGYINLSNPERGAHIPRIYVKGMYFADAKKAVKSRLSNHMNIRNSQIAIELNYSRALTINITGEVFHPGSYTMPAVNTAFNALVASGGPSQIGSVRRIKVVSSEREMRVLDVYEFMNNPKVSDEFFLNNNDYIYVPLAGRVVEVSGAVERPFFYELLKGEDLIELIRHAGGLRPDAYKRNIQIIRYENDEEKIIDVNLSQVYSQNENFQLKDGDHITINPIEQAFANYVTIKGAVKIPGTYELEPYSRVYDLLQKSGIIRSAIMERIYIKRLQEDLSIKYIPVNVFEVLDDPNSPYNIPLRPFDDIEVKYKADFIDKFNVKVYGSVRKPGSFEHSDSLSLADVIYMANGIKREANNSTVEVSRLKLDDEGNRTYVVFKKMPIGDSLRIKGADEFLLEPFDQIFIRKSKDFESPQNVRVSGEILWPGLYTMANKNERVLDLLERAGGITEAAFKEGARLLRQGEGLVLLDLEQLYEEGEKSKYNYVLKPGDKVIVPTMKDLVSIAGRINHPLIKETAEVEDLRLELELEKTEDAIAKKEILLDRKIKEKQNPTKINIPFHEGKRAIFYVKEYGAGIDRKLGGRRRLIYVRYANGAVKKTRKFLFFNIYPKVKKGAMVYVGEKEVKVRKKKKNPINWYKVVTDTFAVVTTGLTLYALITAISRN